ncbi:MAG: DUF4974 domain-containing protein [Bacteroidia bacterium]|nr:DUF4974 domain-containing protein [Bacteroidia bacterium]MCF8426553.1 DUF4974 domain-containing protein [Bacteroidia bacterium]MCF8447328.1 DUF4974 domain-containing protein [Bacteroidia bacterium]
MTSEEIDILISKYLLGNALPEEAMQVEEWLLKDPQNKVYLEQASQIFGGLSRSEPNALAAWQRVKPQLKQAKKISISRVWLSAAASIILLATLSWLFVWRANEIDEKPLAFISGDTAQAFALSTKSEVKLEGNSKLLADAGYGKTNRLLTLTGSAYFNVQDHDSLPLTIHTGNLFVRDIGTKFLVKSLAGGDTILVKVDEGQVFLFDSLGSEKHLKAGEEIKYIQKSRIFVGTQLIDTLHQSFTFTDQSLSEVIFMLNRAYRTHITLQNQLLGNCRLTARFEKEELETVLLVITETMNLSYETTRDGYLLKGEPCK